MNQDLIFMKRAILQAQTAYEEDEVPVGAVLVKDGEIIAESYNQLIQLNDPTSHAEINVIRKASKILGNYRLNNTSLYVTLEPCVMCAGASYWTQISRIVVGARDLKTGFSSLKKKVLHPKTTIEFGVLENESKKMLQNFFKQKRK